MNFQVKTKDGTEVSLDRFQLLEILLGEVLKTQKDEFVALSHALTTHLQSQNTLSELTTNQLVTTCIALGHYYRVFIDRNEVNITQGESPDELVNESASEQTSTTRSN